MALIENELVIQTIRVTMTLRSQHCKTTLRSNIGLGFAEPNEDSAARVLNLLPNLRNPRVLASG